MHILLKMSSYIRHWFLRTSNTILMRYFCPSVRLIVALCLNDCESRHVPLSASGRANILVYRAQRACRHSDDKTLNEAVKHRNSEKLTF